MERAQALVSVLVLVICILVGIPLWWNTTKVYRAVLPHARIGELHAMAKVVLIRLNVVVESGLAFDEASILEFDKNLENPMLIDVFKVRFSLNVSSFDFSNTENLTHEELCKRVFLTSAKNGLIAYNVAIQRTGGALSYYYCPGTLNTFVYIDSVESIPSRIVNLLGIYIGGLHGLLSDRDAKLSGDSSEKRAVPPSPGYELTFTLAVSDPINMLPSWDIETGLKLFMRPVLDQLSYLGPFDVSSQVLFFSDVDVKPVREGERFYYSKSKLPLLINSLESRLRSQVSAKPSLNFVVYSPPVDSVPLFVRLKKNGTALPQVSFHSPRWGGVFILNPRQTRLELEVTEKPVLFDVPLAEVMTSFVSQFRCLLGLDPDSMLAFPSNERTSLAEFERVKLMLAHALLQARTALSTLRSLSELLDKIPNIVIRDEIKDLVESAVRNIEVCLEHLRAGSIEEAFVSSRAALEASEKAFFDPTLLALLYFPDDQKYAIYVPLFLPVALPIVMAFLKTLKFLRELHRSGSLSLKIEQT